MKHNFSMINTEERPYLTWLKNGQKTAEGRVNHGKYRKIKVGDEVTFSDKKSKISGIVTFKHEYSSFRDMLKSEGVHNMLPFLTDAELEKGVQVYYHFPGSRRVQEFGCVAIGLKVTESSFG